jgi:hypothetical protein
MNGPCFSLRVFHPSIDPRKITEELGLPPQTSWQAGGDKRETTWQTRLAGAESGHGDVNAGLRDIAARFEHYRFFVDEMRAGGGRVEIVVEDAVVKIDCALIEAFDDLKIELSLSPSP